MKKKQLFFLTLLSAIFVFTSCLGDDEDTYTYSSDMAITGFTLGTLNRYLHTTSSSGSDSTYKTTLTGGNYSFHIDQDSLLIYNTDSLPYGTDVKHVVCNITSKGSVAIKSMTSDSLRVFSTTDSIDFSQPRKFRVYALDNSGYRTYTVKVNVHQEDGSQFNWQSLGTNAQLAVLNGMKAVVCKQHIYVAGNSGSQTKLYYTPTNDGKNWMVYDMDFPENAYQNLVVHNGNVFMRTENSDTYIIETATDGSPGNTLYYGQDNLKALLGSDGERLYAINPSGEIVRSSSQYGYNCSWIVETLDSDVSLLPTQDISYTLKTLRTNSDAARLVLVGNRSVDTYPTDSTAQVWGKIVEYDKDNSNTWMYYEGSSATRQLPRLSGIATFVYGDAIVALGGKALGTCTTTPFFMFYASQDGGINWYGDSRIPMPSGFNCSETSFALTVDENNYIWIICGESGQLWRGRLNELGWAK